MPSMFNADEVFEMAQEIERVGGRYYRRAAEGNLAEQVKALLLTLARMEDKHFEIFTDMRDEFRRVDLPPEVFDPDSEAASYLREFAEHRIFKESDPDKKLTGKEDARTVLDTALRMEQDSILFYTGLKEMVPESLGKERVQGIISEEMKHAAMIERELGSLKG
jgi:rubrerythrin